MKLENKTMQLEFEFMNEIRKIENSEHGWKHDIRDFIPVYGLRNVITRIDQQQPETNAPLWYALFMPVYHIGPLLAGVVALGYYVNR